MIIKRIGRDCLRLGDPLHQKASAAIKVVDNTSVDLIALPDHVIGPALTSKTDTDFEFPN